MIKTLLYTILIIANTTIEQVHAIAPQNQQSLTETQNQNALPSFTINPGEITTTINELPQIHMTQLSIIVEQIRRLSASTANPTIEIIVSILRMELFNGPLIELTQEQTEQLTTIRERIRQLSSDTERVTPLDLIKLTIMMEQSNPLPEII